MSCASTTGRPGHRRRSKTAEAEELFLAGPTNTVRREIEAHWQTEVLRLTAFPHPTAPFGEPTWWVDLLGEPPEKRAAEPRRGVSIEQGAFGAGVLALQLQAPQRIDWLMTGPDPQAPGEHDFSSLGTFPSAAEEFLRLMTRWVALGLPPLQRIAFGAVLLRPSDSTEQALRTLSAFLKGVVEIDPLGSFDFVYQINRPRPSLTLPELSINRLSKWSVALARGMLVTVTPQGLSYSLGKERVAARLEVDINTSKDREVSLPPDRLADLLGEARALATEIAAEGDRK